MKINDTIYTRDLVLYPGLPPSQLESAGQRYTERLMQAWQQAWPQAEIEIEFDCDVIRSRGTLPPTLVWLDDGRLQDPMTDAHLEPLSTVLEIRQRVWEEGVETLWEEVSASRTPETRGS